MPAGKKRKYKPLNPSDSDMQQQSSESENLNNDKKSTEGDTTDQKEG
jgi:hypothetical protein